MNSCDKSFHIDSEAVFSSAMLRFWHVFLTVSQHSAPYVIIQLTEI